MSDTPSFEAMEWSEAEVKGSTPPGRRSHTAVYLPEREQMLVYGGQGAPLSLRPRGRARVLFCGKPATPCSLSRGGGKCTGPGGDGPSVEPELRCFASEQPCLRFRRSLDPRHEGARPVQGAQDFVAG